MNTKKNEKLYGILTGNRRLGTFPMEKLKRVDKPTTLITDKVQRMDQRDAAPAKAGRGEYGPAVEKGVKRLAERDPITEAISDINRHVGAIKRNEIAAVKAPISSDPLVLSQHIKRLGYFLKADIMGICELPKTAVFSHDRNGNPIDLDYKYAIVIVMRKDYRTANASAGYDFIADALSLQAYEHLGLVAETMSDYIRRLGYPALPQSAVSGYNVQMPPLLLWAGIGEVSRVGVILNPFLGLSFKAAVVLTDMPLVPDKPIDFGLQDFCQRCNKCAIMCPSKAISTGDKVMYNGYETWKVKEKQCVSFIMLNKRGYWCNTCVKVCPWTQPDTWPHSLVRWGVMRSGLARTIAIQGDRIFGHTKDNEPEKWWFDLGYQNGVLHVPPPE
ncbi:reductive dehalogenase [Chloroflexota bacterium]